VPSDPPPPLPWWVRARVRFAVLGVVLAGVVALAVTQLTGGTANGGGCWIDQGPAAVELSAGAVAAAIPRLGLERVPGRGDHELAGLTDPGAVFTDSPPRPADLARDPSHPVVAAFGVTWTPGPGESAGVAAFRFATTLDAAEYLAGASSPRCRAGAETRAISGGPSGGRGLARRDPHGHPQADILFARRLTVYWVYDVTETGDAQLAAKRANGLACRLPAAACR
jgi:hypothetical protein